MKINDIVRVIKAVENKEKDFCPEGSYCPCCENNNKIAIDLKSKGKSFEIIHGYLT